MVETEADIVFVTAIGIGIEADIEVVVAAVGTEVTVLVVSRAATYSQVEYWAGDVQASKVCLPLKGYYWSN